MFVLLSVTLLASNVDSFRECNSAKIWYASNSFGFICVCETLDRLLQQGNEIISDFAEYNIVSSLKYLVC